ncbi:hypothetical protein SAMN04487960_10240 [Marinobacter mobilis]|uniref:Uncharacterized protein n=2 Tax=Marinobacter mobilis TaxID=488533 RepID=A0A1H2S6V2_9GAMM|nr:hypothetical protein SAMN04487960_10240 [Marinobacter mobilis]
MWKSSQTGANQRDIWSNRSENQICPRFPERNFYIMQPRQAPTRVPAFNTTLTDRDIMIKKFAIGLCVSILVTTAMYQLYQSIERQQSHSQQMTGQFLQIQSKRTELMQELAEVQARENPSDHDLWLIGHLTKTIEGLDKVLGGVEAGQQRVERHYLRQWSGLIGVFLGLGVFAVVYARDPEGKLSAQDRQLIQQPLDSISGIRLDPASYRTDPAPVSGGSNFVTGRIRQHSPTELRIRGGKIIQAFAAAFLVGPLASFAIDAVYLTNDILSRGWDAEFSMITNSLVMLASFGLGTLLILSSGGSSVTVDGQHQAFRFLGNTDAIPFRDIASLQLNNVLVTGRHTFNNHQIQLNLKDGRSHSLLNHAGQDQMTADLILLARFTGLPIAVPA